MNPRAPIDVLEGIESYLEKEKIQDIRELIGVAHS
jgi:dihydroorotate dehydrogenase